MLPFFSVILCTYNRATLIERALDSLLLQVETDWEAVIVDDGSTDATGMIVQKYASEDARISIVTHTDNRGVAAARNTGVAHAKGLFVTFLDSDDEYAADHLSSRKRMLLDNDNIVLLHGGFTLIGDPWVVDMYDPTHRIHIDECVVGGTFVIRKDVFGLIGGFDEGAYGDDALFYARASDHGLAIGKTDHPSYIYYRDRDDQLTSKS